MRNAGAACAAPATLRNLPPQWQMKSNHFSRRHVRREKFISGCKRAGEAGALPQPASYSNKSECFYLKELKFTEITQAQNGIGQSPQVDKAGGIGLVIVALAEGNDVL